MLYCTSVMGKNFTTTTSFGKYGRTGVLNTRRGTVSTPTFMPDGTRGAVKSLTPEQVEATGVEVVLANTYHLHLNPGEQVIKKLGGLHRFANRKGPMLTDSGGFQVFSLGGHTKVSEEGVEFSDPRTGDKHFITPEKSMQIQIELGADMIVAFDHLVGLDNTSETAVKDAYDRTHRWLERCVVEFKRLTKDMIGPGNPEWSLPADLDDGVDLSASNTASRTNKYGEVSSRSGKSGTSPERASGATSFAGGQASRVRRQRRPLLFGVVQGGLDLELRRKSLEIVQASDVDGIAIGGLSVGETRDEMTIVLEALAPLYDEKRPRFLLGVGTPEDLRIAVDKGIDMLDCVLPTRNARHSSVWGKDDAKMTLTNESFKEDKLPIEVGCDCYACENGFSRGFLRHQFKVGEPLAGTLASIHNLRYMMRICEGYQG